MNLLLNFHLAVIDIYTMVIARSLCRRLLLYMAWSTNFMQCALETNQIR